jgi:hypothetical protein
MRTRRRWFSIEVVLLIVMTFSWSAPASAAEPLFAGDDVLDLTIYGPLTSLTRGTPDSTPVAGRLELANGETIPVTFSTYGISRLRECGTPCLKIMIDEEHARGTVFEGHHSVRLVTPCHHGSSYNRYILLEYLVYKSYAVITEPALKVRLVSCRFRDSEKPAFDETGLAFFLEDIGATANRHGKSWLDIRSQRIADLDSAQLTVLTLFQFMVGNTDWSALSSPAGQRCCHNMAVLGAEGDPYNTLLPFDFDQAGLVDAPYAAPDEGLKIDRVTERVYRGFCRHNDDLPAAITVFNEMRPELEELFNQDGLPNPKVRKRALKYIDGFYNTINDPRKVENRILSDCR